MTLLKQIIALKEQKFIFMGDGIVELDFVSNSSSLETLFLKIVKLPSCWNHKIALELGYSSNDFAYRQFSGIRGLIRFCEIFSKEIKIDFTREVK